MSQPLNAAVWFGEPAGLIAGIEPASVIVREMAADAALTASSAKFYCAGFRQQTIVNGEA